MPLNKSILGCVASAAVLIASGAGANAASDPTGVWMNDTGRGAIEIKQCGAGLCGHVVWVKDASDANGCGRQIIGDATPAGGGLWDNGWIYSPEKKKKYDVELKPLDNGTLRVKGYAGTKFFSKTMIWTKAPADLVRCGQGQVAAAPAPTTAAPAPAATASVGGDAASKKAATVEELQYRTKTEGEKASTEPQPGKQAAATPQPAPATKSTPPANSPVGDEVASAEDSDGGSDLADKLGEFIKKGPNGKCKLDLPWVKLDFKCEK